MAGAQEAIGQSRYIVQDGDTLETLMARSDAAMYAAKRERKSAAMADGWLTDESEGEGDSPD